MQVLKPLTILHVALATGHVLDVASVDQVDLKTAILEDLEERNPVNPGGLHGDSGDAALLEPIGQLDEIFGERAIVPHRVFIAVCRDCHVVDGGTKIDAGGVGIRSARCGTCFLLAGSFVLLAGHNAS